MIITFPVHKLHGRWCCDGGEADNCTACILSLCTVCGGAEASLPSDCPQRRMTAEEQDLVEAQLLDFELGRGWYVPPQQKERR